HAGDLAARRRGAVRSLPTRSGPDSMTSPSSASPDGHGARLDAQSIRFERLLPGPIERVWAWLADADKRARWLAGGELPRQPGQTFELHFNHATLTAESAPARYAQYDRPIVGHHTLLRC